MMGVRTARSAEDDFTLGIGVCKLAMTPFARARGKPAGFSRSAINSRIFRGMVCHPRSKLEHPATSFCAKLSFVLKSIENGLSELKSLSLQRSINNIQPNSVPRPDSSQRERPGVVALTGRNQERRGAGEQQIHEPAIRGLRDASQSDGVLVLHGDFKSYGIAWSPQMR